MGPSLGATDGATEGATDAAVDGAAALAAADGALLLPVDEQAARATSNVAPRANKRFVRIMGTPLVPPRRLEITATVRVP